jgi:hypothetical protein
MARGLMSGSGSPLDGRMRHVLDLDPVAPPSRVVAAVAPLRDDTLQTHIAAGPEHDAPVRVLDVLA